jgi:hypothetical protein
MVAVVVRVADLVDERHRPVLDGAPVERVADLLRVELRCQRFVARTVEHEHARRLHLMRFVMMEHKLSPAEVLAFLQNLADALAALTTQLEQYSRVADLTGRHPRLAVDHGLAVHRASLRWAEHTIAALSQEPAGPAPGGTGPARVPDG